jgi:beta-barrel assembly-enhancing protease
VTRAVFFDGRVAADRVVTVAITASGVRFSGDGVAEAEWPFRALSAVDAFMPGRPLRISSDQVPGARLVIGDDEFNAELMARAPHLKGGVNLHRLGRLMAWIFGGLLVVAAITYLTMQYAPKPIAFMLPDTWRDRVGTQIEATLTEGAKVCSGAAGQRALSAMMARIVEGNPDLPPVQVRVYDIPIMNAFAMPGERILMTGELIKRAKRPEEVAGVLAHELGHAMNRHSETQLVRATGLQVLLAVFTGGSGGDTISQFASLAAILSYSRAAEEEADRFAVDTLTASAIDPTGFRDFFETLLQEEKSSGGDGDTAFGKIGEVFASHPGTEERIKKIGPLPDGVVARPVMSEEQWQDLRGICD